MHTRNVLAIAAIKGKLMVLGQMRTIVRTLYVALIAVFFMAFFSKSWAEDYSLIAGFNKAVKLFETNKNLQQAALREIDLDTYAVCMPLFTAMFASEIKGVKYSPAVIGHVATLGAAITYYEKYMERQGTPESVFERASQPYRQMFMADAQGSFNRFAPQCTKVSTRLIDVTLAQAKQVPPSSSSQQGMQQDFKAAVGQLVEKKNEKVESRKSAGKKNIFSGQCYGKYKEYLSLAIGEEHKAFAYRTEPNGSVVYCASSTVLPTVDRAKRNAETKCFAELIEASAANENLKCEVYDWQ